MSAICVVCGHPCRGRCGKCGARLCASHKPTSARAKCKICSAPKHGSYGQQSMPQPAPMARKPKPTNTYYTPRTRPMLEDMLPTDAINFLLDCRMRLEAKQRRERAYLDRRAARGTHTPTDDAYEADQLLENDLIELLNLLEKQLREI